MKKKEKAFFTYITTNTLVNLIMPIILSSMIKKLKDIWPNLKSWVLFNKRDQVQLQGMFLHLNSNLDNKLANLSSLFEFYVR